MTAVLIATSSPVLHSDTIRGKPHRPETLTYVSSALTYVSSALTYVSSAPSVARNVPVGSGRVDQQRAEPLCIGQACRILPSIDATTQPKYYIGGRTGRVERGPSASAGCRFCSLPTR